MIQNEMQSSTAQQHGFAGKVLEEKNLNNALAKFSQASAADISAFTLLTDTNAYLQQHVANISSNNDNLQQKPLALQNQMNMMNLVQNPAIPPVQTQRPHTTGRPPQYPHYPQPSPQGYQPTPMQHASPQQVPYQKLYAQRGGHRGQGCGHYSPRGSTQGQYQHQVNYGGPTQKYGGRSLQPYQAPSQQYGQKSNYQGFQGPSTNVKRNNNWNYCHTHVFDVKNEHDGSNCHNPSWNHNW